MNMKTLLSLTSFLVATIAWVGAVIDMSLAKIAHTPRPYLVPARTFFAVYRVTQAYLRGDPLNLRTFRIREYPRPNHF
jgi:hypothetical protein